MFVEEHADHGAEKPRFQACPETTERLNRVYAEEESRLEPSLRRRQARSVGREPW